MRRVFYDPITGKGIFTSSQPIEVYQDWVDTYDDMKTHYFPGGVPTPRTVMTPTITGNDPPVVDGVVSFTGFPIDAVVGIDGDEYQLDDGTLNFTPTTTGDFIITAHHVAHISYRTEIDVN